MFFYSSSSHLSIETSLVCIDTPFISTRNPQKNLSSFRRQTGKERRNFFAAKFSSLFLSFLLLIPCLSPLLHSSAFFGISVEGISQPQGQSEKCPIRKGKWVVLENPHFPPFPSPLRLLPQAPRRGGGKGKGKVEISRIPKPTFLPFTGKRDGEKDFFLSSKGEGYRVLFCLGMEFINLFLQFKMGQCRVLLQVLQCSKSG